MQILAISGSLRTSSTNTALLKAAAALAPDSIELSIFRGLGDIPPFNPDLDTGVPPAAVAGFRSQLQESSGVIISSPEYAHGVPGVLKNALDWLVASGELYQKPVALFNASLRGNYAQVSLVETLTVMNARIVAEACVTMPLNKGNCDALSIGADAAVSQTFRKALAKFANAMSDGNFRDTVYRSDYVSNGQ